jgi:stearoyl-CoA desaturase (delta-9 desaturase)
VHGAIVNWFGHWAGYRNFDTPDDSRNSLPVDFLTGGELLQNNHHHACQRPNFAVRWFELDTTWQVMKLLRALDIIDLGGVVPATRLDALRAQRKREERSPPSEQPPGA